MIEKLTEHEQNKIKKGKKIHMSSYSHSKNIQSIYKMEYQVKRISAWDAASLFHQISFQRIQKTVSVK
jgi:hypothetical protein